MNKEMEKFYKKISDGEDFIPMSINGDEIEITAEDLARIEMPEGYEIEDGILYKDGIELGKVNVVPAKKNIMDKFDEAEDEEEFEDEDFDDEDYADEEEVKSEPEVKKPSIMNKFADAKDSKDDIDSDDEDEDYDEDEEDIKIESSTDDTNVTETPSESEATVSDEDIPDLSNSTDFIEILTAINDLNPNARIYIGDPRRDSKAKFRFYAGVPIDELVLPKGFHVDGNKITNEKEAKDGEEKAPFVAYEVEDFMKADINKIGKVNQFGKYYKSKDEEENKRTKKRRSLKGVFQNLWYKIKRFFKKGKYIEVPEEVTVEEPEEEKTPDTKENTNDEPKKSEDNKPEVTNTKDNRKSDEDTKKSEEDTKKSNDDTEERLNEALEHNEGLLKLAASYEEKIKEQAEKIALLEAQIAAYKVKIARLNEEIDRLRAESDNTNTDTNTEENTEEATVITNTESTETTTENTVVTEEDSIRREIAELLFGKSDRLEANAAVYGITAPFEGIENVNPLDIQFQMDDCDIDRFYELTGKLRKVSTANNIRREIAELLIGKSDRFESNARVNNIEAPFDGIENVNPLDIQFQMEDEDINRFYELKEKLEKVEEKESTKKLSL